MPRAPGGTGTTLVVFKPESTPRQVYEAFDRVDARVLWADRSGTVWAVRIASGKHALVSARGAAGDDLRIGIRLPVLDQGVNSAALYSRRGSATGRFRGQ
jgi:hypothetical protein